jgi:hypothetical protein
VQIARTAKPCFLPSWYPGGSCRPASFCGEPLFRHLVEVSLCLAWSQAGFRLQVTQGFARRQVFVRGSPARPLSHSRPPGANRLRDAHATHDSVFRAAYAMNVAENILAFLLALNLELAARGAKGVQVTSPGLRFPADEAAEFMSKDCVTMREGVEG